MSDLLAQIESYVPANVLIWFAVSSVFMFVGDSHRDSHYSHAVAG